MAALNFPASPTNGQQYTLNGVTYQYNSTLTAWQNVTGATPAYFPAGANGQVQYNASGSVAGANGLTYNANSGVVGLQSYVETSNTITISSSTLTLNLQSSTIFSVNLNSNVTTLSFSNPGANNQVSSFTILFTADGTARTITWPAGVKWSGNTPPTMTATANKQDIISFFTPNGGVTYYGFVSGQNF